MYYYIQSFICTHILQSFYVGTTHCGPGGLVVPLGVGRGPTTQTHK